MNSHYIININKFEMTWLNGTYKAYLKKDEDREKALMQRYADKTIDPSLYGKVQVGGTAMKHLPPQYQPMTCPPPKKVDTLQEIKDMIKAGMIKPDHDTITIDHLDKISYKDYNDPNDYMSPDKFKSISKDQ
jgi:hypothetical protein